MAEKLPAKAQSDRVRQGLPPRGSCQSRQALTEGVPVRRTARWTFCAIYVISVKKPLAGLIFWAFSCKLKDNHVHAVSEAVNRHNSGTMRNNKL